MNHCRKVVIHQPVFFSGHETREHQDRLTNPVLANRDALVRARNAEPVRASLLQCLCYFRAAMAVAIAFYDGEDFARRLALLLRRIYVLANRFEIVHQGGERNFGPYRTSHFFRSEERREGEECRSRWAPD